MTANPNEFSVACDYVPQEKSPDEAYDPVEHTGQMLRDLKKLPGISKNIHSHLQTELSCSHCRKNIGCPKVSLEYVEKYIESMYYDRNRPEPPIKCPFGLERVLIEYGEEEFKNRVPSNKLGLVKEEIFGIKSHLEYMKIKFKYDLGDVPGITEEESALFSKRGIYGPATLCTSDSKYVAVLCGIEEARVRELILSAQKIMRVDEMISELSNKDRKELTFLSMGD